MMIMVVMMTMMIMMIMMMTREAQWQGETPTGRTSPSSSSPLARLHSSTSLRPSTSRSFCCLHLAENSFPYKSLQMFTTVMRWLAFTTMVVLAVIRLADPAQPHGFHLHIHNKTIIIVNMIILPTGQPALAQPGNMPAVFGVSVYAFMCHHSIPRWVSFFLLGCQCYSIPQPHMSANMSKPGIRLTKISCRSMPE